MGGRILVVDDVASNRIILRVALSDTFKDADHATTGQEGLERARADRPDMVLIEGQLSDMSGASLCRSLKSDPLTRDIPVMLLAPEKEPESVLEGLRAGADAVLMKPVAEALLMAQLRSLKRARSTREELRLRERTANDLGFSEAPASFASPSRVVFICDRRAETADAALKCRQRIKAEWLTADEALASDRPADLFVISIGSGAPVDGLRLMSELRSRDENRHAAVIVTASPGDQDISATALDMGANDILARGFTADELALRLDAQLARKTEADRLRRSVESGLRLAAIDPLTGLWNRRYVMSHLPRIAEQSRLNHKPWALILLDIDRFKAINDLYGHPTGDRVLEAVAERIRRNIRGVDLAARIGGEEFLVALPATGLGAARRAAERILQRVSKEPVVVPGQAPIAVTISAGLALGGSDLPATEVLERADQALLLSKQRGRNQVRVGAAA